MTGQVEYDLDVEMDRMGDKLDREVGPRETG